MDVGLGDGEQWVIEARGAAARMAGETTRGIRWHHGDLDRGVTGDDPIDRLGMAADTVSLPEVLSPRLVGPRRGVASEAWFLVVRGSQAHVERRVQGHGRDVIR